MKKIYESEKKYEIIERNIYFYDMNEQNQCMEVQAKRIGVRLPRYMYLHRFPSRSRITNFPWQRAF